MKYQYLCAPACKANLKPVLGMWPYTICLAYLWICRACRRSKGPHHQGL